MATVAFVAPFFLPTTLRFIDAAASLPDVPIALISQDPVDRLPPGLRAKLTAHYRVEDGLDPNQIAAAIRAVAGKIGPVDCLLGALEDLQVPLAEVRAALGIPGMGVDTARNFRDKARMKTVMRAAGVPCARHALVATEDQARAFLAEVGYPVVVKPPAGSGGRDTFRVESGERLGEYLAAFPPRPQSPTLFEEFITGEEYSFDSFFLHGRMVWHSISRYFPTPLEVMRNPWMQWVVLLPREIDAPVFDRIRQVAVQALSALGLETGLTHMEWFLRGDGSVAVSEVGARPPGAQFTTLISYAHDMDFHRAWARFMVLGEVPPPNRPYASGAAYIRGQGAGRVKTIHGIEKVQQELGPLVVEAKLPQPGQHPSGTYEGDGYVILRHAETSTVEQALKQLVRDIRVELG